MSQGPPRHWNDPPVAPMNRAGTYSLVTTVPCPHPTNYPYQLEHWYPSTPIPGWRMPMPRNPLKDWRLRLPDRPDSPPSHGQLADFPATPEADNPLQGADPLTRAATPTLRTPLPTSPSESEFTMPQPHPHPLPKETVTPSTLMAMTMSGPHSLPSIDNFSAPITLRPGSYEDETLRLASISEAMTKSQWTGIWPYTEETQSPEQDTRQTSPCKSSPIESEDYTLLRLAFAYTGNTAREPPRSSTTWRSPYTPSPYDRAIDQTWMESTYNDDEPPGSVRSEFADLSIHHPISSKQLHFNPHILYITSSSR
ncbi:hypothetical protein ARMSODRAFT_977490 [Armillaria solidipes]|uniref:Uncharacterized protein n=1 Tax=Armillaria solidipes TaxID=1076256 RepID=A0A2H3BKK4_9AGAR|nr:hypothetical protein ARMSODRAFT_977490 [Armillaria solidipes]